MNNTSVPGGGFRLRLRAAVVGVAILARQPTVSAMENRHRGGPDSLSRITADVVSCVACPRLVAWRERVAIDKRASFRNDEYWAKPVPGFGDASASLLVVGLAPAAHGGNRTGRIFTGDRSGDWLFGALWRAGYSSRPVSVGPDDGLRLNGCYITAAVRCAPPANKPTIDERDRCLPYLARELILLQRLRVIVALGKFAYDSVCGLLSVRPRPRFGHLVEAVSDDRDLVIVCSFHPSQQNTFTGKLTREMFDAVFARARQRGG
jgi:uracil-DNA glycosylase family 4